MSQRVIIIHHIVKLAAGRVAKLRLVGLSLQIHLLHGSGDKLVSPNSVMILEVISA
jgi:hypothetical protein